MSRRTAAGLICALLLAGCGGTPKTLGRIQAARPAESARELGSVPADVRHACTRAARGVEFVVLCPTGWPTSRSHGPPALRWITRSPGVYLLNAFNGPADSSPHVFHLLLGGQQKSFGDGWSAVDPGLRITTREVTTPIEGGGRFVQERPARRIGLASVHGSPALVLREPAFPQGGLQGGHVLVLWNQGGHGYLVSVHGTAGLTQSALIGVAVAFAGSTA